MLPEIITFNKSMQFRLEEYEQLFDGIEAPCSDIIDTWGSILRDLAVIGINWQALWILSEKNCRKYDLLFPTAVIVNVNELHYSKLTAVVSVIAVQEDIVLPTTLDVPIIELHPIKNQNYNETDLRVIEDWLDKCRYFFKHLWYPWDEKLEISLMDWHDAHLENRLKMQYDLKHGFFDNTTANYLKLILGEAQSMSSTEEYMNGGDDRVSLVARYIHRENIKTELDLFEEPYLRYGMIQLKKKQKHLRNSTETRNKEAKLILMSGTCENLIQYVKKAQSLLEKNMPVKVFGSFQEALDSCDTEDNIILPPGKHFMTSLRGIENGGSVKGWEKFGTHIMPDASAVSKAILMECFGNIELENLTISVSSGIAIQIFDGTVKLTKCRLISEKNSTSRGIVVVTGSKLILEKCEIKGFGTGVVLQAEGQASLTDSEISNCHEGIKIFENSSLLLNKINICLSSTYAIRVDSSKVESDTPIVGDLNLLEGDRFGSQINAQFVHLNANLKGNVIVKQIEKLFNIEPSESDVANEVFCISDGDTSADDSIEIM